MTHKVQSMNKQWINWTSLNSETFCCTKEPVKDVEYKTDWEDMNSYRLYGQGLVCRIYK